MPGPCKAVTKGTALQQRIDKALAEVFTQLAERCGGEARHENGLLLVAGNHPCPLIVNSALRTGSLAADSVIRRAGAFFADRKRHYELWTRDDVDADLQDAAQACGMRLAVELCGMILDSTPALPSCGAGVELREVHDARGVRAFATVVAEGFRDQAPDAESLVHSVFAESHSLIAPDTRAFVAWLNGEPAAAAYTMVRAGVAWVGWVATRPDFRGRGLGSLVAAAAARAGLALGADLASLEATPLGTPVYARLGFREIFRYRTYWPAAVVNTIGQHQPRE